MSNPIDDEDPTPRAKSGSRPAPKPAAPAPKPGAKPAAPAGKASPITVAAPVEVQEARLNWGHVGSVTKPGRLSDGTSRPGVIRVVEANISYKTPPLDPYVWVSASLNYVGQYEMFWPEGDPFDVKSMGDLGAELRGNAAKPNLRTLDNAADSLLDTADRLHGRNCRLGLLHPGNVLIAPNSEGRTLVLPDLGFVWRGSHGKFPWRDSPGRPRYLNEDPRENAYARLWDEEPVWKQFSSDDGTNDQELVPVQSDLKNLARIFAAVLTGRIERDLPTVPNAAPTWGVLKAVMKGEITTADEFRSKLAEHPLSEHWTAPKAAPPPPKKSGVPAALMMGCLGLILLGALGSGLGLYLAGAFDSTPVSTGDQVAHVPTSSAKKVPATTKSGPKGPSLEELANALNGSGLRAMAISPTAVKRPLDQVEVDWKSKPSGDIPPEIAELLKKLENSKDPKEKLDLLTKLYEFYETAGDPVRNKIRHWVEYYRGDYTNLWEQRYKGYDDAVIKAPSLRFDIGPQMKDLHQEMTGLRERFPPISPSLNEREKECLLISELRARELGLPQ